MDFSVLNNYKSVVLDYSVIREYGGTTHYSHFSDYILHSTHEVYVSRCFKLLHSCLVHVDNKKDADTISAFRELCSSLLREKRLHEINEVSTPAVAKAVDLLDDACVVSTINGPFLKRLIESNQTLNSAIFALSDDELLFYKNMQECHDSYPRIPISSLAYNNSYLDVDVYCNVNDVVYTGTKEAIRLEKRLNNGAEGMVFYTDKSDRVAKIFHKDMITPLRWSKLSRMITMGIKSDGICWPQDLLFNGGVPVGNTMILGQGKTLNNVFDGPEAILDSFPNWKRVDVVDTAINLLEEYAYLHMHDVLAGDIQLKNAMIKSSKQVYIIDMDSSQIGNLPCPVGTEEFTNPDLWGKNFSNFLREYRDEDYALSILVFSVLFCGQHPYASRHGKDTLREEILDKNFPYKLDNSTNEFIPKGGYEFIWKALPEDLRFLCCDSFALGQKHELLEWYNALLSYKADLDNKKFTDMDSYELFPKMNYKKTVIEQPLDKPTISQADDLGATVFTGVSFKQSSSTSSNVSPNLNDSQNKTNSNSSNKTIDNETSFFDKIKVSRETRLIVLLFAIIVIIVLLYLAIK